MLLVLVGITLGSCFLLVLSSADSDRAAVRESAVDTALISGFLVAASTETLSAFNSVDRAAVILSWSLVAAVLCGAVVWHRSTLTEVAHSRIARSVAGIGLDQLRAADRLVIALGLILLLGIFAVSLTLTNNYDSYTYHLPRIEQWIQNRNVGFFPTNFTPQLFRSPFTEYVILHLKLLSAGNGANNFVQYSCYLLSAIAVTLIAQLLGASGPQQLYAAIMSLTVPMAILQAETTQTDVVAAFAVLACAYYCLKIGRAERLSVADLCYLCLSISLGMLTKGTFYLFALPFCLSLTVVILLRHPDRVVMSALMLSVFLLIVDGPFLFRNYRAFGSIVGPVRGDMSEGIVNEVVSGKIILSNLLRGLSLHVMLPYEPWNHLVVRAVSRAHAFMGVSVDDPRSTWYPPYRLTFMVWHDLLGNFLHLVLALLAGVIALMRARELNRGRMRYYLYCVCGFATFFAIMKWQPFNARLDVIGFLLLAPITVLLIPRRLVLPSLLTLLVLGNLIVYQFQWGDKAVLSRAFRSSTGEATYAINYEPSRKTNAKLKAYGVKRVGFAVHANFPEWSYWLTSNKEEFMHVVFPAALVTVPNVHPFTYTALIIDKTCLENDRAGCPAGGALSAFVDGNPDVALVEEFSNNSELVIFKRAQSRLFAY